MVAGGVSPVSRGERPAPSSKDKQVKTQMARISVATLLLPFAFCHMTRFWTRRAPAAETSKSKIKWQKSNGKNLSHDATFAICLLRFAI
jgi:hypothetical protein